MPRPTRSPHPAGRVAGGLLACTLAFGAGSAAACRCVEPGPGAAYRAATVVVQARATAVAGDAEGPGGAKVQLAVSRAWKSAVGSELEVATRTTCAYVFEPGKDYLVYLQRDSESGGWLTRRCRGNLPLAEAQGRLGWLSRHGKAAPAAASAPR